MSTEVSTFDIEMMRRCLTLAKLGLGRVQPNPMVGSVIVHNGEIIGEGYHHQYGEAHAEVNAINSVSDKSLLPSSTIYVTLEPCSHYGKTPPCADKLIEMKIPRVVIGATDPHDKVNGKGIQKLQNAGIEVITGVLKKECETINKRFFTYHRHQRPYIILKWAQTENGFMDIDRQENPTGEYWITNEASRVLVHKWRSEEQAILIGYNTYLNDRPSLTTRYYPGSSPKRYIMVKEKDQLSEIEGFTFVDNDLRQFCQQLFSDKIQSVIVEGGRKTLDLFIQSGLWDEARILTSCHTWEKGMYAPTLFGIIEKEYCLDTDTVTIIRNNRPAYF